MPVKTEPGFEPHIFSSYVVKEEGDSNGARPSSLACATSLGRDEVDAKDKKIGSRDTVVTTGAYCSREANLKREEDVGYLSFECHFNDGVEQHMIWLVGLKNIFSRQLPNMPKEYIVRLVMDLSHKSLMIIREKEVVGGITYRPYYERHFGEIAFCAITADEQVKGYGTRLMNHLKQYARDVDKLTHFLTYADNNAVGYFQKQGFTKEIYLEEERWKGYIKDYDGGTLMECAIDPLLPYTDLPSIIWLQRQAIDNKIRELSNCHIVYPGIDLHKNDLGVPKRPIRREDIPGLKAAGWTPEEDSNRHFRLVGQTTDGPPTRQQLQSFMRSLHKYVVDLADAWPFREPVNGKEVVDYYDVIKDPRDLRTMQRLLDSEAYYMTLEMYVADMCRMFANAMKYNAPETVYYKIAKKLEGLFMSKVKAGIYMTDEVDHSAPLAAAG
eukprot:TRINITY_DN17301_c0_g1_i1.p1 TRINITY_DN17301_c0_g1~~TRINITY_DN17301_c0_g1_i1.p1  ORF type:complete len:440 (-),score=89.76 TRINITY_DN17301_c0_g1_i1:555-1874(-)